MTVPSKWAIAQHWAASAQRHTFAPRMYDLGEPCCFACGWYSERWDKGSARINWERATLERAHIVPSSLGGSDEADNLILLCSPCHKESPDWPDPREMARWLAKRPARSSKEFEDLDSWIAAAAEVPEFLELLTTLEPGQASSERIVALLWEAGRRAGLHWGVGLSQGTRVAIIRSVVEAAA
ncbi:HNH endonuclease [Streptomyces sp. NPDC054887]